MDGILGFFCPLLLFAQRGENSWENVKCLFSVTRLFPWPCCTMPSERVTLKGECRLLHERTHQKKTQVVPGPRDHLNIRISCFACMFTLTLRSQTQSCVCVRIIVEMYSHPTKGGSCSIKTTLLKQRSRKVTACFHRFDKCENPVFRLLFSTKPQGLPGKRRQLPKLFCTIKCISGHNPPPLNHNFPSSLAFKVCAKFCFQRQWVICSASLKRVVCQRQRLFAPSRSGKKTPFC